MKGRHFACEINALAWESDAPVGNSCPFQSPWRPCRCDQEAPLWPLHRHLQESSPRTGRGYSCLWILKMEAFIIISGVTGSIWPKLCQVATSWCLGVTFLKVLNLRRGHSLSICVLTWHVDSHLLSSSVANVSSEGATARQRCKWNGCVACVCMWYVKPNYASSYRPAPSLHSAKLLFSLLSSFQCLVSSLDT